MGSVIAQAAIAPLRTKGYVKGDANKNPWLNHVMQIYAAFMFMGIFTTLCIPETKRRTLEDLAGDWALGNESMTAGGAGHGAKTVSSLDGTDGDHGSPEMKARVGEEQTAY